MGGGGAKVGVERRWVLSKKNRSRREKEIISSTKAGERGRAEKGTDSGQEKGQGIKKVQEDTATRGVITGKRTKGKGGVGKGQGLRVGQGLRRL